MLALKTIYFANILVAGWISIVSLFFPLHAQKTILSNSIAYSEVIRLAGALWGAIFMVSVLGLWFPQKMQLVLLFQLLYKTTWILFVAIPAILSNQPYPKGMALFFIVWMIVLPRIIDWNYLFNNAV